MLGFQTITNFAADRELLRRRPYGVIEVAASEPKAVHLRPIPKFVSVIDVLCTGRWYHSGGKGDRCWIYYNQSWSNPRYIAVKYFLSSRDCSLASFNTAQAILDELAELKQCDALVCDAANFRLSPRVMRRYGWEPHAVSRWHRNYIKRFYGTYPTRNRGWGIMRDASNANSLGDMSGLPTQEISRKLAAHC